MRLIPLDCLHMAALVLTVIQVKRLRCQDAAQQGYANATELAITRRERRARSAKRNILSAKRW